MQQVAQSGQYILGPHVKAFEREMASYLGCEFAVAVNSGTDALYLSLRAMEIGDGDEVITTPFTFVATTEAIGLVGAKPVFVDIDPRTFNLDPNQIETAITPRTKAILPVHLYGQPCDMDAIENIASYHGLDILEDCAQAIGASFRSRKVGTIGRAGCLSFFPSKNLGCLGDGGMVVSNDPNLYKRVEILRRHGGKVKYHHDELGLNSRLDELQAAILRVKLKRLDKWNAMRRAHAATYKRRLTVLECVQSPVELSLDGSICSGHDDSRNELLEAVYHQYTILVDGRDHICQRMREWGVSCYCYYPVPLHLQRVHAALGYRHGNLPCAESVSNRCLSLPMFPELTTSQIETVVDHLATVVHSTTNTRLAA